MTLTIELNPEQEAKLQAEALERGMSVECALRDIINMLPLAHAGSSMTGAEILEYWQREGLIDPKYGDGLNTAELVQAIKQGIYPPRTGTPACEDDDRAA